MPSIYELPEKVVPENEDYLVIASSAGTDSFKCSLASVALWLTAQPNLVLTQDTLCESFLSLITAEQYELRNSSAPTTYFSLYHDDGAAPTWTRVQLDGAWYFKIEHADSSSDYVRYYQDIELHAGMEVSWLMSSESSNRFISMNSSVMSWWTDYPNLSLTMLQTNPDRGVTSKRLAATGLTSVRGETNAGQVYSSPIDFGSGYGHDFYDGLSWPGFTGSTLSLQHTGTYFLYLSLRAWRQEYSPLATITVGLFEEGQFTTPIQYKVASTGADWWDTVINVGFIINPPYDDYNLHIRLKSTDHMWWKEEDGVTNAVWHACQATCIKIGGGGHT